MPLPLTIVVLGAAFGAPPAALVATTTTATVTAETPDIPIVAPPAADPGSSAERRTPFGSNAGRRTPLGPNGATEGPPLGPGDAAAAPEPTPGDDDAPLEPGAPRLEVEAPAPPPPSVAKPKTRKLEPEEEIPYGLGNILVGFTGIGVTALGVVIESALVAYGGISLYLFGPTAVHWAHGNFEEGFASIALNAGTPLVGTAGAVLFGLPIAGDSDAAGPLALLGLVGGALMAVLIDGLVLAYIDEVEVLPSVSIDPQGASTFTLGGRF